jgi:hypothetical protein
MRDQIRKGLKIQENSQVEAVRLFHPGHQVKVTQVDKYGFLGRDRHPPSDNSLNGHIGKVVDYIQGDGKFGSNQGVVGGDGLNGPRYQSVAVTMKTGPHKGKTFDMIGHELAHLEVPATSPETHIRSMKGEPYPPSEAPSDVDPREWKNLQRKNSASESRKTFSESAFDRLNKITPLKPGRNVIHGFPVDIEDQETAGGISMRGVDRDATSGLIKKLRSTGFRVSRHGNLDLHVHD